MNLSPIEGLKTKYQERLSELNPGEVLIVGANPPETYGDNVRFFVESEAPRLGIDVSQVPDNMEDFVWLAYSGDFLGDGQLCHAMIPVVPASDLVSA